MVTKIVQIGNSKGIRIPKALIEQMGAPEQVELTLQNNELIVKPHKTVRKGWDKAFQQMAANRDDQLPDGPDGLIENDWDSEEWTW